MPQLRRLGVGMLLLVGLAFAAFGVDDLRILWGLYQMGAGLGIPAGLVTIGVAGSALCFPGLRSG
jgi:hypothetical protein